jgi:glycosyltransferase involved in cell wall biosynthesis
MRVAMVALETVHHRDTQGARRFDRIARQLAAARHDVTVLCSQFWGGHDRTYEHDGVTYRAVTTAPASDAFAVRLPAAIARQRPDVVHARPTPPGVVLGANAGATLARAPLVVEWYGDEDPGDGRLADAAVGAPDRIVTPSEFVRTRARERGATDTQTVVIPESIDVGRIRATEPADPVDVVFAHRFDETANLENLLLGLAELRHRDWSATVIGDGPLREAFEAQAADLRIADRIDFVGDADRAERIATYRGGHVFAQTATEEFFATELLWALACGCVGVVEYQADSSAHELIEHRERSFRVTSTQGMAEAIADAAEFERLDVDDEFASHDHSAVRERYEDLYETLGADAGLLG